MQRPVAIKPLLISKLNTGAQLAFAALVLATKAFAIDTTGLDLPAMLIVAALTVGSAAAYLARWLKHMAA
jgi:cardiolipin synthase